MHSARAIATRCCWPPESWPGYFFACSGIFTRVQVAHRQLLGLGLRHLAHPDRRQRAVLQDRQVREQVEATGTPCRPRGGWCPARAVSSVSSVPSTMMRPSWCVSSRLMQRIMVDLPEPDGPHTTTRSFSADGQRHVAQHVQRAVPLVDLVQHDGRRRVLSARWGTSWAAWLIAGSFSLQRLARGASSRSSPRLYFDMAKQNAM